MLPSARGEPPPAIGGIVGLSPWHLLILVAIILLVFGAKRLPEIGRGLGTGAREFKDGITGQDAGRDEALGQPAKREDEKVG